MAIKGALHYCPGDKDLHHVLSAGDLVEVHTRGAVIQPVCIHDIYHCAELNEALGIAALPKIGLWV